MPPTSTNDGNTTNGSVTNSSPSQATTTSSQDTISLAQDDPFLQAVVAAVRAHMGRYDCSHDFWHIRRVVGMARHLADQEQKADPSLQLDRRLITLCALLHDVGDRKYLDLLKDGSPNSSDPGADAIAAVLRRCGSSDHYIQLVPVLCQHVSWSTETKSDQSKAAVAALVQKHPELAIVQDSDRLDAIGAVGIGRVFAYGAARGKNHDPNSNGRSLGDSVHHFDVKLLHLEGRMKTASGRVIAKERTDRLRIFKQWFEEEAAFAIEDPEDHS